MIITNWKHTLTLIFIVLALGKLPAQPTPPQWFETQYDESLQYCKANKTVIELHLKDCGIPVAEAMAVVFPEMLRYTLWRDVFETKALELLYVQGGSETADFSIGWFQMKPSFAEKVEQTLLINPEVLSLGSKLIKYPSPDTVLVSVRRERVQRLKQLKWQLMYLKAFIAINNQCFGSDSIPVEKRLKYLAAAYNRGMDKSVSELESFMQLKTFPYGPGQENPFGYAEIAEYFYKNDAKHIFN